VDLLDFYVVGKSNYVVYLEAKNDIIQFSPNTTKNPNYLHLFKTAIRINIDFRKNTAECRLSFTQPDKNAILAA